MDTFKPRKIQALEADTINRIAAGEVIENPAGIIRELLDNAIDAGATHINIRVNFSDFFIEVLDDGCGILPEDITLAFEKHTTSKIKKFEDIYQTSTLGFRGEALASLASVSEVIVETAVCEEGDGVRYRVRGKEKGTIEKIACNRGTRIQVQDLFFNTPVRKKFLALRNPGDKVMELKPGERRNIKQEIIRHILAQDGIGFQYFILEGAKEKLEINVPSHYTLKDKITLFFKKSDPGGSLEQTLLSIKNKINGFTVEGYITDLSVREYRSDKQFLVIRKRVVRDPGFLKAVITAYLHMIPRGAHPMIFLRVEPDQNSNVDINIHPRKEQVKFQNPKLFFDAIHTTLKQALTQSFSGKTTPADYSPMESSRHALSLAEPGTDTITALNQAREQFQARPLFAISEKDREAQRQNVFDDSILSPTPTEGLVTLEPQPVILGQIADTFIVFSIGEDLFIADQHAAHERINYDRLLEKIHNPQHGIDTQMLLIPILLEKDAIEKESILLQQKLLNHLGFEVESFGAGTLRINRVPAYLPEKKIERIVNSLLEMIARRSSEEPIDPVSVAAQEFLGDMIATMACRMSVMAGDHLAPNEMEELVREVYVKGYVLTCPHGRPFVKKISLKEMKLFFDRGRHILGEIDS